MSIYSDWGNLLFYLMKIIRYIVGLLLVILCCACAEYVPKPKVYPRIDRSDPGRQMYDGDKFSFEYSKEAHIVAVPNENKSEEWFNIVYPRYNVTIHCTYIPLAKGLNNKLLEDSHHLAYSHAAKANEIRETLFEDSTRQTTGILYDIKGSVAVPVQFYMTDNVKNFMRGSMYYNNEVNIDSVATATEFLRLDVIHLMETLDWKNTKSLFKF